MAYTGKYLRTTVNGGIIVGTHEWQANEPGDRLDGTTGEDNGRGNPEVGVIDGKFSIKFYLNIANGEYTFIRTGATLTNLALYLDGAQPNPLYLIEQAQVFNVNVVGQVRDKWVVTADIESQGDVITTYY